MRTMLLVSLLFVTALAGCTGNSGTDSGLDDVGESGTDGATETLFRFQANTSSTEAITIEESGPPGESYFCLEGCDYVVHPLTTQMEPDTAYFMEATLTWEPGTWEGAPNFFLRGDAGIRDYGGPETDFSAGISEMSATLLAVGDSEVAINIGGGVEAPDYDLEVTMTPVPDAIPQYAPAAVTVPQGGALVVESLSGAGRVMVFDGNDALVGVFDVDDPTTVVNATDRLQEFVVFTLDDIWAKAYVEQDPDAVAPELRHVPLEVSWADLGTVSEAGPKSFTFDVDRPALNVAFRFGSFKSCGTSTDGCFISIGTTAYLQGPDGSELTGTDNYDCYLCGGGAYYRTSYDDGPMPAGTYTVEYNSENSYDVRLHSSTIHYIR